MKPIDALARNFKDLDKRFGANYAHSLQKQDSGTIHGLRVSIKRIKAFFNLLEYVNPDFDASKCFRNYKEIFKQAGKVRDLHVQMLLLGKLEKELKLSLPVERLNMIRKEKSAVRNYSRHCKKISPRFTGKIKKRVLEAIYTDFPMRKANAMLMKQMKRLRKIAEKTASNKSDWHKLRILLKDYFYNIMLVNNCALKNKSISKHIIMLRDLQDRIGKWHDEVTMLHFISDYKHIKYLSLEEFRAKRLLQQRLQKSAQRMITHLQERLPALLDDLKNSRANSFIVLHGKGI